ncbi:hypothetical protein MTR67_033861 [Solanum verrucosum]|uniref:Ankyrin repeat family protein n=1 Tax=Solanum verrucosum TaxID=315347 RepID=A0AAF0U787_SOLVR|nr:hypothetical protein MTR67_033861 [Solanum verrucosum]
MYLRGKKRHKLILLLILQNLPSFLNCFTPLKKTSSSVPSSNFTKMGNPKRQSSDRNEELHAAARTGDLNAVQTLCSANPLAVNSRDKHSRTPTFVPLRRKSTEFALTGLKSRVHRGVAKYLFEDGIMNLFDGGLHLAAWSGHSQIVDYLCKNKADVGAAAMDDMGAIHFAAQKGHLEVVRLLVSSGVSVKSCNRKGMTALHYAAQGSHLELVKYLLKKGANVKTKNKAGKTSIDLASNEEVSSILRQPETASSKEALNDEENKVESESKSSSQEEKIERADDKAAATEEGEIVAEKDESLKRKGDGDETKEKSKETKKAKVALNHLLTSDDNQEDEEIF